uniref:Uncharacterized protein n=1 Tax=Romanomermis culicivorax TaxID=13658 RepID=A0A915L2D9_ROMCU
MMPAPTSICGQQSRRSYFLKAASMTFLSEKITAQMSCHGDDIQINAYFEKLIPAVKAMAERSINDKRVLIDFKRPIGFTPDPSYKYDEMSCSTSSNAASKVSMENQQTPTTSQTPREFEKLRFYCKTRECWSKKRKTYLQCSSCELPICKQCLKNGDLSKKLCRKCSRMLNV